MRSRKQTAWRKSRKAGVVHGGRTRPKLADGIFRRLHSLRPPPAGAHTPICIEDNPSRDYFFPLRSEECLAALAALPAHHRAGLTHLWLRRPSGGQRRRGLPLAEFVWGSGARLIVLYPWPVDRRLCLGRQRPVGRTTRELERFGARLVCERGWWYAAFDPEPLRQYCLHVLYHEVGHHLDAQVRRWSAANGKQAEDAADSYAVSISRWGGVAASQRRDDYEAN